MENKEILTSRGTQVREITHDNVRAYVVKDDFEWFNIFVKYNDELKLLPVSFRDNKNAEQFARITVKNYGTQRIIFRT